MFTYNNVIDLFRQFSSDHKQINDFGYGEPDRIGEGEKLYPLMFVNPADSIIKGKTLELSFNILFMDKLKDDRSNEQELHSDMLMIIRDFSSYLGRDTELNNLNTSEQAIISPFTERFGDYVTGWNYQLKLIVDFDFCLDQIPK